MMFKAESLINVSTILNSLKIQVDNSDVGKLKSVPIDLKKLKDVKANEVVKNTKCNTLKDKSK